MRFSLAARALTMLGLCFGFSANANAQCATGGGGGLIPTSGSGDGVYPGTLPTFPSVSTLVVTAPSGATVLNSVKLNGLTHTWVADVTVVLENPAGGQFNVFSRLGSVAGALGCAGDLNGDYQFFDPIAGSNLCSGGPVALGCGATIPGGDYLQSFGDWPGGAISNTPLEQIPISSGIWTLRVYDWVGGDTGGLTSFDLCFGAPTSPGSGGGVWDCVTGGAGGSFPGTGAVEGAWPLILPTGELSSTLAVTVPSGATQITAIKFNGLSHSWIGDCQFVLTSPAGVNYNLFQEVDGVFGGGCGDDFTGNYAFVDPVTGADECGGPAGTFFCSGVGAALVPGAYKQHFGAWTSGDAGIVNVNLSAIPLASGSWTLKIYDWYVQADSGSLFNWEMCFDSTPFRCSTTYTTGNDFNRGFLANLRNMNPFGDSHLRISPQPEPIPLVWVACSARDTVVRIDANTGEVLGEYYTRPEGMLGNPSRTTVDKYGNVWVGNRDENSPSGGVPKGSVACIGVVLGGTRGDKISGVFTPSPTGQYLKGPFLYSTAIDRDGDGLIRTSSGLCNILPWTNVGGANTAGGTSTAEDECIRFFTRVAGTNVRTMAVDANNDVWTGGYANQAHVKVNGSLGFAVGGTAFDVNAGGYGGLIDCTGKLWSARGNGTGPPPFGLLRYDPVAQTSGTLSHGGSQGYGLGIDPNTGHIWYSHHTGALNVGSLQEVNPGPATPVVLNTYTHGWTHAQGCAVDAAGNVWVAHGIQAPAATTVGRTTTSGVHVGNVALTTNGLTFGSGPTGVSIDTNQKVWVTCLVTSDVYRIDPNDTSSKSWSTAAGTADLRVSLNADCSDAGPYNYSDMTGYVVLGATSPSGFWTVVKDSFQDNTAWGTLSYVGSLMAGTGMKIEVRAANLETQLASLPWIDKSNGGTFSACGRFLEIRVSMWRDPCSDPNATPILDSLTVTCLPGPCPLTYCTPGTSSNGCMPDLGNVFGQPSVADQFPGNDFDIWCNGVEGNRTGVIFYGISGPLAQSWGAGSTSFLCVKTPTQRTWPQNSGGTSGACDGLFHVEWYDYQLANPGALGNPWTAGDKLYLQAWYRDPAAPKTTNLSNALELTYQP
jgi:streptogramin lyase